MFAIYLAATLTIVDGGTFRANGEYIRLLGIEAPDMPGHCPKRRACAPGYPHRSKESLRRAMMRPPITIVPIQRDKAGRTVAIVYAGGLNLSCEQLRHRSAVYRSEKDIGGRLARECRFAR